MNLKEIINVIISPSRTFERIKNEKYSFWEVLLTFFFIYSLSLFVSYLVLVSVSESFGEAILRYALPFSIGIPSALFLSTPSVVSFFLSLLLASVEVLILSSLFYLIPRFIYKVNISFNPFFLSIVLSQIVSFFPLLVMPLIEKAPSVFIGLGFPAISFLVGVAGYMIVTIIWKYILYGYSLGIIQGLSQDKAIVTFFLAYIVFMIIIPFIEVWFVKGIPSPILELGYFGAPAVETGLR